MLHVVDTSQNSFDVVLRALLLNEQLQRRLSVRPKVEVWNQIYAGVAINLLTSASSLARSRQIVLFARSIKIFDLIDRLFGFLSVSLLQKHRSFSICLLLRDEANRTAHS